MEEYLGPGDIKVVVEAGTMEETNIKPPKRIKPDKQAPGRASKMPMSSAELVYGGLRQGYLQADRACYCLKDYKGNTCLSISYSCINPPPLQTPIQRTCWTLYHQGSLVTSYGLTTSYSSTEFTNMSRTRLYV